MRIGTRTHRSGRRTWPQRLAAAMIVAAAPFAAMAEPQVYTLHVGIDDYRYVPKLDGAVADARVFADLFEADGADTMLLVDGDATRENIVTRFQDMARRAEPGDTIVFTYAGHGSQWPERFPGEEADGFDEFFALANFRNRGANAAEKLLDNTVAELFALVDPQVTVLFIADSCHSGTMTRSLDGRGRIGKSRKISFTEFLGDPGPAPADSTYGVEVEDFKNVIFVAASREDELANETYETGSPRGALSVAMEEALRGDAAGFDTTTSLSDLRAYVVDRVRNMVGARQNPDVKYDPEYLRRLAEQLPEDVRARPNRAQSDTTRGLGRMEFIDRSPGGDDGAPRQTAGDPLQTAFDAVAPKLVVEGPGAAQAEIEAEGFATIVRNRAEADLLWDLSTNEIVDIATDDMIGVVAGLSNAQKVVEKWRGVAALRTWAPKRPLHTRIVAEDERLPDDVRFREGQGVKIAVDWPTPEAAPHPYVTIVNLANGGEVQYIFPAGLQSRLLSAETPSTEIGPFPVTPPFGADHVVVFASQEPLTGFHEALDEIHEQPAFERFVQLVDQYASGPDVRVGVTPLYTSP